jgi:hypothetical protein
MQQALIFWPLHPLVPRAMAMLCPVCLLLLRTSDMGAWICIEWGLGGIVAVTPVALEIWMPSWWNNWGSCWIRAWFQCSYWLCTVTSVPSVEAGDTVGGPWLTVLPEGSTCPLGEVEVSWGGRALWWYHRGSGEAEKCRSRRPSHPRRLRKARVGWSLSFVPQVTDMLSALLGGRFYWGPYDGALAIVQGAMFCRLLGTLVFWYPIAYF